MMGDDENVPSRGNNMFKEHEVGKHFFLDELKEVC